MQDACMKHAAEIGRVDAGRGFALPEGSIVELTENGQSWSPILTRWARICLVLCSACEVV